MSVSSASAAARRHRPGALGELEHRIDRDDEPAIADQPRRQREAEPREIAAIGRRHDEPLERRPEREIADGDRQEHRQRQRRVERKLRLRRRAALLAVTPERDLEQEDLGQSVERLEQALAEIEGERELARLRRPDLGQRHLPVDERDEREQHEGGDDRLGVDQEAPDVGESAPPKAARRARASPGSARSRRRDWRSPSPPPSSSRRA